MISGRALGYGLLLQITHFAVHSQKWEKKSIIPSRTGIVFAKNVVVSKMHGEKVKWS